MFILLLHALPIEFLVLLGTLSDHVSDLSPAFIRGIEHVIFTLLLN